ncbi:MAG: glycosyltransferase family 4 protein [Asticcacaulis sp.]|uniref:glycosyltransferase family 4 protein n=1 Tax=Asticcacaulis sp. TaxID=1872648 RepID=UPI003F7BF50C
MTQSSSVIWLLPPTALAVGFALALAASLALAWLAAASGPVDRPRTRGAHLHPTPTSGGLAIMAATALALGGALALFGDAVPGGWRDGLIVLLFAAIVGLGGAADDLLDMPAKWRLGFQIVASLVFAGIYHVDTLDFGPGLILTLPSWLSIPGSALWLVLGMNAINFMDGANGLAVGSQFISLSVLAVLIVLMAPLSVAGAWLGAPLMVAVCAAGAHLGFLPWNLPPLHPSRAAVFQGDAGSLFGGALITGLTLMTRNYGVGSVWIGGFVLAPILVDVVLTLFVRARARRNLMRPHKEHLYQLWLQKRDPSHLRLAWRVWLLTLVSSGVGLAARLIDITYRTDLRFIALVGVIFFYSLGWFRLRARLVGAPQTSSPEAAQSSSRS